MACDCCKEEIRKIYHETETVYKANSRLEQEIESLNACIKELENKLKFSKELLELYKEHNRTKAMMEALGNEKPSKVDCTNNHECSCWCCNIGP